MEKNVKKASISQWGDKAISLEMLNLDVVLACSPIFGLGMVHVVDTDGQRKLMASRSFYDEHCRPNQDGSPNPKEIHITGMENLSVELNTMSRTIGRAMMHAGLVRSTCVVAGKGAVTEDVTGVVADRLVYVFDGVMRIVVDGKEHWLRTGTTIRIPSGVSFEIENREANARMVFACTNFLDKDYNLRPQLKQRNRFCY